jgi:hypothetical protein
MRLHRELVLPWREIAKVMSLNTTTVFDSAQLGAARLRARQAWFLGNPVAFACLGAP